MIIGKRLNSIQYVKFCIVFACSRPLFYFFFHFLNFLSILIREIRVTFLWFVMLKLCSLRSAVLINFLIVKAQFIKTNYAIHTGVLPMVCSRIFALLTMKKLREKSNSIVHHIKLLCQDKMFVNQKNPTARPFPLSLKFVSGCFS